MRYSTSPGYRVHKGESMKNNGGRIKNEEKRTKKKEKRKKSIISVHPSRPTHLCMRASESRYGFQPYIRILQERDGGQEKALSSAVQSSKVGA